MSTRDIAATTLPTRIAYGGHLDRCYLKGAAADAANAILSAVGYNLRLVLAWLRTLLRLILIALFRPLIARPQLKSAC